MAGRREDAVRKSPNKSRPHQNLADNYREMGRYAEAIHEYNTALRLTGDFNNAVLAYNGLHKIYSQQKNRALLQQIV